MKNWARAHEPAYLESDENQDFYDGFHYGYFSTAAGRRISVPEPSPKILRLTWNYCERYTERVVSIVLKDPPIIDVVAGSGEVLDVAASEAGKDIIDWQEQRARLRCAPERVARHATISGWCWLHEQFDPEAGPIVQRLNENGEPMMEFVDPTTGEPFPEGPRPAMAPRGQFVSDILTHRQGVPDPAATHPFDGSGFFTRQDISRFDLKRRNPHLNIADFPPEGDDDMRRTQDRGRGTTSSPGVNGTAEERDKLELLTLYVPKCPDYPKGRRVLFTQEELIEEMDNPRYPIEGFEEPDEEPNESEEPPWPVFPFVFTHRQNSPLGKTPMRTAIQANKAINGLGSTAMMHAARMKGKWKVPDDLAQELSDETAQILKVRRRGFDHNTLGVIAPPPMPQEYVTLWRENKEFMQEAFGLNAPAVGQVDTSGQSGYAQRLRQQVADNDLEKIRRRFNDMWACVYRYRLFLFRRHADSTWKIQVGGENRRSALRALDRTAIMPATNVLCVNDSSIPRDPQQKIAWWQQLNQTGIFQMPDKVLRQKILRMLSLRDFATWDDASQADVMRAERQLRRIESNEDPGEISDMDDHLVQMDVFRTYGLSEAFETRVRKELLEAQKQMSGMPPQPGQVMSRTFQRLTGLYAKHKEALELQTQEQAQTQMAQAAAVQGPPGGAPKKETAGPPGQSAAAA